MVLGPSRGSTGDPERLIRGYRWVCIIGAVIGVAAAIYFFVTGPSDVGWVFIVLTVLLLPAYVAFRHAARRGWRN
jgi:hypothetical protein